jgi:hypothetical protein
MKEYKPNELFQWEDRTLMCVEYHASEDGDCGNCIWFDDTYCNETGCDGTKSYFTNKLMFSTTGLTLQIKRKGCKVKIKVLEMSDDFDYIKNDNFSIFCANLFSVIFEVYTLGIYEVGDKVQYTFPTEQEAIDWVDGLFSLRWE